MVAFASPLPPDMNIAAGYAPYGSGGGGGLGAVFDSVGKAVTDFVQDPSKATTNALQPVEKTVNYISAHPELQAALILAVAAPVVGEYIGAELMAAGTITSAEAAYSAAITAGATATEAAAAAQAATTTATIMGTAIASTSAQVAQGVPFEQAVQNATVSAGVSALAPAEAQKLDKLINSPAVSKAIVSTAASGIASAASGGSQQDIEKSMVAGLAGSSASSLYKGAIDSSSDVMSRAVGGAAAGAVKGGTEGAVIGGLSSAAGALGTVPASALPRKGTWRAIRRGSDRLEVRHMATGQQGQCSLAWGHLRRMCIRQVASAWCAKVTPSRGMSLFHQARCSVGAISPLQRTTMTLQGTMMTLQSTAIPYATASRSAAVMTPTLAPCARQLRALVALLPVMGNAASL